MRNVPPLPSLLPEATCSRPVIDLSRTRTRAHSPCHVHARIAPVPARIAPIPPSFLSTVRDTLQPDFNRSALPRTAHGVSTHEPLLRCPCIPSPRRTLSCSSHHVLSLSPLFSPHLASPPPTAPYTRHVCLAPQRRTHPLIRQVH